MQNMKIMVDVLVKPSVFWWVHLIELVKNSPHSFICQVVDYFLQNTKAFLWRWGGLPFPEKRGKEHTNRDRHDWLLKHQNIKNCIPLHITSTGYMSTSATFRWKPSPWDVKQTKVQISGLLNLSKQLTVSKWYCMIATRKKKYLNSDKRTRLNYPIPMNSVSNSKRSLRSNKQTQGIEPLQIIKQLLLLISGLLCDASIPIKYQCSLQLLYMFHYYQKSMHPRRKS